MNLTQSQESEALVRNLSYSLPVFSWVLTTMLITSCAQHLSYEKSESEVAAAQAKDAAYLKEHYFPEEFPESPQYAQVTKQCIFFVADPAREMIPVGILQKGATIVVRDTDGEWLDIQLASGHPGSVLRNNISMLSDVESFDFEGADSLLPLPEEGYEVDNSLFAPN